MCSTSVAHRVMYYIGRSASPADASDTYLACTLPSKSKPCYQCSSGLFQNFTRQVSVVFDYFLMFSLDTSLGGGFRAGSICELLSHGYTNTRFAVSLAAEHLISRDTSVFVVNSSGNIKVYYSYYYHYLNWFRHKHSPYV